MPENENPLFKRLLFRSLNSLLTYMYNVNKKNGVNKHTNQITPRSQTKEHTFI